MEEEEEEEKDEEVGWCCLVDADGLAHGGLDVEGLDVLPVLLKKRDQVVDGHLDVDVKLLLILGHITDGDTHAEYLLELVLNGGTDLRALVSQVLVVTDEGRELTGLIETGTEETRNLLEDRIGSQEGVVLLGQVLHEFLVLVELLEVIDGTLLDTNTSSLVTVLGITEDAQFEVGARAVRELDGTGETLVLLGVVVLETDLELDGLGEVTLLVSGTLEDDCG